MNKILTTIHLFVTSIVRCSFQRYLFGRTLAFQMAHVVFTSIYQSSTFWSQDVLPWGTMNRFTMYLLVLVNFVCEWLSFLDHIVWRSKAFWKPVRITPIRLFASSKTNFELQPLRIGYLQTPKTDTVLSQNQLNQSNPQWPPASFRIEWWRIAESGVEPALNHLCGIQQNHENDAKPDPIFCPFPIRNCKIG